MGTGATGDSEISSILAGDLARPKGGQDGGDYDRDRADGNEEYTKPGIRAQLLDKKERRLVQDFVIEGDSRSIHILNAVSPAFTCSFPFAEFVTRTHILKS